MSARFAGDIRTTDSCQFIYTPYLLLVESPNSMIKSLYFGVSSSYAINKPGSALTRHEAINFRQGALNEVGVACRQVAVVDAERQSVLSSLHAHRCVSKKSIALAAMSFFYFCIISENIMVFKWKRCKACWRGPSSSGGYGRWNVFEVYGVSQKSGLVGSTRAFTRGVEITFSGSGSFCEQRIPLVPLSAWWRIHPLTSLELNWKILHKTWQHKTKLLILYHSKRNPFDSSNFAM